MEHRNCRDTLTLSFCSLEDVGEDWLAPAGEIVDKIVGAIWVVASIDLLIVVYKDCWQRSVLSTLTN